MEKLSGTEMVDQQEQQMLKAFVLEKYEINNNLRLMWRDSVIGRTIRYCAKWITILVASALGVSTGLARIIEFFMTL